MPVIPVACGKPIRKELTYPCTFDASCELDHFEEVTEQEIGRIAFSLHKDA